MKKLFRVTFVLAIILFFLNAETIDSFAEKADREVRVGFYHFAPLTIIDKNNQAQGMFVDLLNKVADEENWDIIYVPGSFSGSIERLNNDEIDLLIAVGYSDERAERYDFNEETVYLEWGLIYTPETTDIKTILDLDGKRVAILKDSLVETDFIKLVDNFGLCVTIVEKQDYADVFSAIANHEADAGINGNLTGLSLEEDYAVKRSSIIFSPTKIKYAVKKDHNADLIAALDKNISMWKNDDKSFYFSTYEKWAGLSVTRDLPIWAYFIGLGLLIMMILLFVLNRILKHRIQVKTSELLVANNSIIETLTAVSESESKYRVLFNQESDPLFLLDKKTGEILEANNTACETYGYSIDELLKLKNTDMSAEPELTQEATKEAGEGIVKVPLRFHKTKNGKIFPVEITANVIRIKESEVMLVSIRDITERKKAEEKLVENQNRFREVLHSLDAGVVVHASDSAIIDCNERAEVLLGLSKDQLLGKTAIDPRWKFLREDGTQMPHKEFPVVFIIDSKKSIKDKILGVYQPDTDGINWLTVNGTPIYNHLGEITEVVTSFIDITERKRTEELIRSQMKDLLESQRIAHIGTWRLTLATNEVIWSEELYKMYGLNPLLPVPPYTEHMKLFTPESWDKLSVSLEKTRKSGVPYELELETIKNDGANGCMWVRGEAEKDAEGNIHHIWGVAQDISERKKNESQIIYLGYHDHLTGLYNRRFYEEELIRLDTSRNLPLTIAMGDVNGLKLINDSFGHAIGDEVLRRTASLITKCCRADDIVARLGGDEFGIIFPKTDSDSAEAIIRRIKEMAVNQKMDYLNLSISIGHETKHKKEESIVDVIKKTEDHMYRHKLYESSSMRSKTIDLIMNTLYEKNNREMLHSKRVSKLCEMIAIKMNFDVDDINQMRIAGLMHDIGKIGIDEKVLNKSDKLNNEEWIDMKRHSEVGYRILSSVNEFSEIAEYVLEHQEKWDGTGYPRSLQGEEISIQARIIAVADAYDAMTTERTYSHALSEEEAIVEIKRCSGTQFDPEIVKVFIEKT